MNYALVVFTQENNDWKADKGNRKGKYKHLDLTFKQRIKKDYQWTRDFFIKCVMFKKTSVLLLLLLILRKHWYIASFSFSWFIKQHGTYNEQLQYKEEKNKKNELNIRIILLIQFLMEESLFVYIDLFPVLHSAQGFLS